MFRAQAKLSNANAHLANAELKRQQAAERVVQIQTAINKPKETSNGITHHKEDLSPHGPNDGTALNRWLRRVVQYCAGSEGASR